MNRRDAGNAPLEMIFAMALVLVLVLGLIQTAFVLYGRNVLISAAHEGARAGIELGRSPEEAMSIARHTVDRSAGGLVNDLSIETFISGSGEDALLNVEVRASLEAFGPVPITVPVETQARAPMERDAL